MIKIFFQLLQVAVGNREILSETPSDEEWLRLHALCKKHSLIGIGFAGIQRLPKTQMPVRKQLAQWIQDGERIKEKNDHITEMCSVVSQKLTQDGMWNCILKGQSNLRNYPEWLQDYRTPGDIDIWAVPKKIRHGRICDVVEYSFQLARETRRKIPEVRYNHVSLKKVWDIEVEIHYRPSFMFCPWQDRKMQEWFNVNHNVLSKESQTSELGSPDQREEAGANDNNDFPAATAEFNVVYQLTHIYHHLFDEGIGLRQILDYYFALKTFQKEDGDRAKVMDTLANFKMTRLTSAVMWVLQMVFAMPEEYIICKPNEKEGRFLLREIINAGNFGKFDSRIVHGGGIIKKAIEKSKHNLRLIRHYPEEVLWEPFFRVYHLLWRQLRLWRY